MARAKQRPAAVVFDCDGVLIEPSARATGSKGEPVATMARPSDHSYASSGVISQEEVGFESGITIGRSTAAAILRIAASEMVPRLPERPRTRCGFA